jgi:holo-[acyl-carrier protein] synthase
MIEVERVRRLRTRHGDRFLARILREGERESLHGDPDQYVASRFAVKEAAMKALGTGWRKGVRWTDLEVRNLPTGQPVVVFHGQARERFEELGGRSHVSLSHLKGLAMAVVVIEDESTGETS